MEIKSTRKVSAALLTAAVVMAAALPAGAAPEAGKKIIKLTVQVGGAKTDAPDKPAAVSKKRSDSLYARELSRLGQVPLLKLAVTRAAGTPLEGLYDAQLTYATWNDLAKDMAKDRDLRAKVTAQYIADINTYIQNPETRVDGFWALDQAKFVLGPLTETVVNRMEYWANTPRDRKELQPLADLGNRLIVLAREGLQAAQDAAQAPVFDEKAWSLAYSTFNEVDYYAGYAGYFTALATEPGSPGRAKALTATAELLAKWADEDPTLAPQDASGIKYHCTLLRGKILSEQGQFERAAADFKAAGEAAKAPGWVRYQAHYQAVVNKMRAHDPTAESEVDHFKAWIASDAETSQDPTAKVSAEMLRYRVEAAAAEQLKDPKARKAATNKALGVLAAIMQQDPRYRDLVFAQLAAQAPEGMAFSDMLPLEALAVAWTKVQSVHDDKLLESKKVLATAVEASMAVRGNENSSPNDKKEATLIAAVANTRLGRLIDAVKMDADFARICNQIESTGGAKDKRAKEMLDAALDLIRQLRSAVPKGQPQPKELIDLSLEVLDLVGDKFGDHKWDYAHALTLMQESRYKEALVLMQGISTTDPNYFSSRYQMLRINLKLLDTAATPQEKMDIGRALVDSCEGFLRLPATATPEARKQVEEYRKDILLIEISTCLDPLKDYSTAIMALEKLEALPGLTANVRGVVLRDRIKAYQGQGSTGQATDTMKEYMEKFPAEAPDIIRGMIAEDIAQIDRFEKTDPAKSKEIAGAAVTLVKVLIDSVKAKPGADVKTVYSYRQILADMEIRAGQIKDAVDLFNVLQKEDPKDLFNFMGEARAIFADGQWNKAHDYFAKLLPKLTLGGESYWEAYLRIVQCNTHIGSAEAIAANKKTLGDLKASYSGTAGGTTYKADYEELFKKYGL